MTEKVTVGSIVVEISGAGDFEIYTVHHPDIRFRVERADTADLLHAVSKANSRWVRMQVGKP